MCCVLYNFELVCAASAFANEQRQSLCCIKNAGSLQLEHGRCLPQPQLNTAQKRCMCLPHAQHGMACCKY